MTPGPQRDSLEPGLGQQLSGPAPHDLCECLDIVTHFTPFLLTGAPLLTCLSLSCKQNVSPLSRKQFAGHCKINSEKEMAEGKITLCGHF